MRYYETLNPNSLTEVLESNSPAIAEIKTILKDGDLLVKAMLVKSIDELNGFLNVTKPMTEGQRVEVINLICEKYNFLRLADFKLCFKNAKIGLYGTIYNRLDGQIIFQWLNSYNNDRMDLAENMNRIKHDQIKSGKIDYKDANKEGQKKVTDILKSVLDSNDKAVKPQSDKVLKRGQSKEDAFAQSVLREFDQLYEAQNKGKEKTGTKFVLINDIGYSASEYLDLRVREFSNHV